VEREIPFIGSSVPAVLMDFERINQNMGDFWNQKIKSRDI
jgi:hypothetical protein